MAGIITKLKNMSWKGSVKTTNKSTESIPDYGTPKWWEMQIRLAIENRKRMSWENRWEDLNRYYLHRFENASEPNFNLIYMFASSLVPAIMFHSPSIVNTARRPEFVEWAKFYDGIDNWLIDEMEIPLAMKRVVLSAFLRNTVAIELGYDSGDVGENGELVFAPIANSVDRSRKTNMPFVDVVSPDKFIVAPGTVNMKCCPWYGKYVAMPTRIIKNTPGFITSKVEATAQPDVIQKVSGSKYVETNKPVEQYTCFWQIHNAEDKTTFCIDTNGVIISEKIDDPLQIDGLPVEVVQFNTDLDSIWGTPDSIYVETQMLEGNECRQIGRLQRKSAIIKFLYKRDILTSDEMEQMIDGPPALAIGVDVTNDQPLNSVIHAFQPHVNQEYFNYQKELLNDAQLLVGVGPNQAGMFASGRRTKYEAQIVEERNLLRTGERREIIANTIGSLLSKCNQIISREWKADVVAKVLGNDASIYWIKSNPSEFAEVTAQLMTKVNVESMTPVSKERKREEMVQVLQIVAKGIPGVNIVPIVRALLSSFEWAEISSILPEANQQGSPMGMEQFQAQQQQQMQNPQIAQQIQQNMGGVSQLVNKYPSNGGQANG